MFPSFSTLHFPPSSTLHAQPGLHVHESADPLLLDTVGAGTTGREQRTLRSFLESRCPSVTKDFNPAWWMANGHLQTCYCVVGDFSQIDQVVYDRKYLRLRDGGTIGLDFTPSTKDKRTFSDDTPVIIVGHGLTGGSHEAYVRNILAPAITPVKEGGLGYRGVVVNFRGCAGTPVTSPRLYSALDTDDYRQAVMYLSTLYPKAPFIGLGFSLGANILVRYLGEEGSNSRLRAGCALASPWNLLKNNEKLEDGWFYENVYARSLGSNLVAMASHHLATFEQWPDHPLTKAIHAIRAFKRPRIRDYDEVVTVVGGGTPAPHGPFPFARVRDYYNAASSHELLHDVRVPLLAINSGDDPIVRELPEDAGANDWVALVTTSGGGHLGWFEGKGLLGVERWVTRPVLEWLKATAEDYIPPQRTMPRLYEQDGWLTEEGREHLGVKLLEGMDEVQGAEGREGMLQGL